jgi:molybdenum cofactor cytidylyltransferase
VLAAVILAAGASSRMGQPKQLLKFRGTSLLRRSIDTALAAGAEQVIVVLGHAADQLLPEVEATSATIVLNDQWMEGVSTSLRGGLAAVASDARGVFIYPADMPLVTPEALRELARRQQVSGRPAAMTEAGGVRGVPVFITRSLFPALMIQEGDAGGAQYLRGHPESVEAVHFDDLDLVRDVDRPEDYSRLLELDPDAELPDAELI